MVLAAYNIGYTTPFASVPVMVLLMGVNAHPLLSKLNPTISSLAARLVPLLMGLLGAWLVFDAAYYFIAGKPVFLIGTLDHWRDPTASMAKS